MDCADNFVDWASNPIVPHRKGRRKPSMQDGRALRRYKRRWIVERHSGPLDWLGNFRRLTVRYDRSLTVYPRFLSYRLLHDPP